MNNNTHRIICAIADARNNPELASRALDAFDHLVLMIDGITEACEPDEFMDDMDDPTLELREAMLGIQESLKQALRTTIPML